MITAILLILFLMLLGLSAFFSGSETAMTSANRTWVHELANKGDGRARLTSQFLQNGDRLLGITLVGNNVVNVCLTTIGSILLTTLLIDRIAVLRSNPSWHEWITSLILTPIILICGEVIPKALGRNKSTGMALLLARPLRLSEILLKPAVVATSWIARLLSPQPKGHDELSAGARVTREDMKVIAEIAAEQGLVNKEAGEMMQSLLELDKCPVETAMVPLIEIRSLPDTAEVGDALRESADSGFQHLPIYHERVDCIVGVVNFRDLLTHLSEGDSEEQFLRRPIKPFVTKKLLYVPESQPVNATLEELRRSSLTMAIVVDEYGGMTGMVTVEDLVEQIVGNLNDEREAEYYRVLRVSPDAFLCSGRMEIGVLEEYLGITIPNTGFETAAGLVLKLAGRIPSPGEKFHYRQIQITVIQVENHTVKRLKFQLPKSKK